MSVKENYLLANGQFDELRGVVAKVSQLNGLRVRYQGSYWPAKTRQPYNFAIGDPIRVVDRENIRLVIEPA